MIPERILVSPRPYTRVYQSTSRFLRHAMDGGVSMFVVVEEGRGVRCYDYVCVYLYPIYTTNVSIISRLGSRHASGHRVSMCRCSVWCGPCFYNAVYMYTSFDINTGLG